MTVFELERIDAGLKRPICSFGNLGSTKMAQIRARNTDIPLDVIQKLKFDLSEDLCNRTPPPSATVLHVVATTSRGEYDGKV
ncbi:hypothetical protein L484_003328 [Morus notabilis]|uniref:Uncharacterized protein n=1 Tax=Morus notabilis TaxID=981085 RepID=W9R1R2_9ROSA|nr:hypothetical protein L484_003328 [Morus notabilis]